MNKGAEAVKEERDGGAPMSWQLAFVVVGIYIAVAAVLVAENITYADRLRAKIEAAEFEKTPEN
ncbi:hypothetical protein [Roseibium sp. Sym1]|uniref:hypothetical protein n=1 Tax=Roseibium sp. Sym1 TaxID=3016006 RepID=UPI0022B41EAB|nr:hypothetical protein [Roseibium sp. Sym1]